MGMAGSSLVKKKCLIALLDESTTCLQLFSIFSLFRDGLAIFHFSIRANFRPVRALRVRQLAVSSACEAELGRAR